MDKNSPVFIDASPFGYEFADQYLQYPSPYSIPLPQGSPQLAFNNLNLNTPDFVSSSYSPNTGYSTASPPATPGAQRPFTPVDAVSPHVTTALIQSGSEDGFTSSSKRSGRSESPKSASQLVHRREPIRRGSSSSTQAGRMTAKERSAIASRRRAAPKEMDDFDSDDDGNDIDYAPGIDSTEDRPKPAAAKRRDEVRRQRIESEQRRRDELREGYRKLKEVLPASNQKASKVSLLDRATMHIRYLEITVQQLQARVQQAEMETQRLRLVNEKMMLATAEHNQQALAAAAAQSLQY